MGGSVSAHASNTLRFNCSLSSVGYGDLAPQTVLGRAFLCAYVLLFMGVFSALVETLDDTRVAWTNAIVARVPVQYTTYTHIWHGAHRPLVAPCPGPWTPL